MLGCDLDGVVVDDVPLMMKILKAKFPEKYGSVSEGDLNLLSPIRNLDRYPELPTDRIEFLKDSRYIRDLSPCAGVLTGVPLVRIFCDRMYLISARWTNQGDSIEQLFQEWGLSGHFDAKFLRGVNSKESALEAKLRNAQREGITHMVEDDPGIALAFAEAGMEGVALIINCPEKNVVPNGPNLKKFRSFHDFAMDVVNHRSVRAVFEQYEPGERDKIHQPDPLCLDPCGLRKICIVSGQAAFSLLDPS